MPTEKGFTVSDIKIGGEPINFGGQIAARINVRVAVMVSEPAGLPAPRSIGCTGTPPTPLPLGFTSLMPGVAGVERMTSRLPIRSTREGAQ